jgi:hypothetical protein
LQVENEAILIRAKASGNLNNIHSKKPDLFQWNSPKHVEQAKQTVGPTMN